MRCCSPSRHPGWRRSSQASHLHRRRGATDQGGVDGVGGAGAARRRAGSRPLGCAGGRLGTPARQGDNAVIAQMGPARQRRAGPAVVRSLRRRPRPPRRRRRPAVLGGRGSRVRIRGHQRAVRLPGAPVDRCDAAVRAGHGGLVAELRAGLPPSLAVAGAYLEGIGVPACIAGGHEGGGVAGLHRAWHDRAHGSPGLRRSQFHPALPDVLGVRGDTRARSATSGRRSSTRPRRSSSSRRTAASWSAGSTTSRACAPTPTS